MANTAFDGIKKAARSHLLPLKEPPPWFPRMQTRAELLFFYADRVAEASTTRIYAQELKSDLATIVYASVLGLRRSCYLHLRSALENTVRHCYAETFPADFTAQHLFDPLEKKYVTWGELVDRTLAIPALRPLGTQIEGGVHARPALVDLYKRLSRFVHGSTRGHQMLYDSAATISMSETEGEKLSTDFTELYELALSLLILFDVGLWSVQATRHRRLLLEHMRSTPRDRLLTSTDALSFRWIQYHRNCRLNRSKGDVFLPSQGIDCGETDQLILINPVSARSTQKK